MIHHIHPYMKPYIYSIYIPYIFHIYSIYIPYIYIFHIYIYSIYIYMYVYIPYIYIYSIYIYIPYIFHISSIYIPHIFHIYSIYIPYIFHIYSIYIPYIFHILTIFTHLLIHIFTTMIGLTKLSINPGHDFSTACFFTQLARLGDKLHRTERRPNGVATPRKFRGFSWEIHGKIMEKLENHGNILFVMGFYWENPL